MYTYDEPDLQTGWLRVWKRFRWFEVTKLLYRCGNLAAMVTMVLFTQEIPALLSGRGLWCVLGVVEVFLLIAVLSRRVVHRPLVRLLPKYQTSSMGFVLALTTLVAVLSIPAIVTVVVAAKYLMVQSNGARITSMDCGGLICGVAWLVWFSHGLWGMRKGIMEL